MTRWLFSTIASRYWYSVLIFAAFSLLISLELSIHSIGTELERGFQAPWALPATVFDFQFFFLSKLTLVPIKPADDKPRRLTNEQKAQLNLSTRQEEILIGCLLGDLHIALQKTSVNARLEFKQGLCHEGYLLWQYEQFKDYCPAGPKIYNPKPDKRTGQVYGKIYFRTFSLPCLNKFHDDFYLG